MARLTRTQKYAELRDKIAQDREESLKTESLSQYEDKLRQLESNFNNEADTNLDKKVETIQVVEQQPNDIKQVQEESMKSLDDILASMMNETYSNTAEVPASNPIEPIVEVKPQEEVKVAEEVKPVEVVEPVEEIKEEVSFIDLINSKVDELESAVEEKKEIVSNQQVENEKVDIMSTMELVESEVLDISNIIDDTSEKVEEVKPVETVEQASVQEEIKPIEIVEPIQSEPVIDNNFFNNTLKEVDDFNRLEGRTTLDELPNAIVDEVRHPQTSKQPEEIIEDSDFSNTVSLEIDKVLNEIKAQNAQATASAPVEPISIKEAEIETAQAFKNAEIKQETLEHPVLTKALEEPVVEIKNISETLSNPVVDTNVLDDTIPFVVEKAEDEEDEYDDEDEAPSKVLNVILGILIFVLIAVLGVIVYYILVARGIIG